jgi:translation initiation factor 3 subunit G
MSTAMANKAGRDWADDEDIDDATADLPPPQTINNKDGTVTTISYRFNDEGQKVKTTRRVRFTTHRETVNPRVAARRQWAKFGDSVKDAPGPNPNTTSVAENIILKLSPNWKQESKADEKDPNANALKAQLKDKKVKCRICNGEHFTARCPFKDTMQPMGEGAGDVAAGMGDEPAPIGPSGAAGAGAKKGSYVPPALRGDRGAAQGERMGGKYGERDDLATLRVTNVSCPRAIPLIRRASCANGKDNRSPRWPKRASCATCSNASAALRGCSSPRIGILAWPRALHSLVLRIETTRLRPATRWMAGALST